MAGLDVKIAIKIKVPPQKVFDLLTDIPRIPELFEGFHAVKEYHGGAPKIGDEFKVSTSFMGREVDNVYRVTKLESPSTLAWRSESNMAVTNSAFDIQEHEEGTRVVLSVKGEPKNLFATVGLAMVEQNLKEGIVSDLKNIRSMLEAENA